jgi:hypothetical protein
MVESVPLAILAPFVQDVNRRTLEANVSLPDAVRERLSHPDFTDEKSMDCVPSHVTPVLVRRQAANTSTELTDEQLVAQWFDAPAWRSEVTSAMSSRRLIPRRRGYNDHSADVLLRGGTDDLFTVKVDHLLDAFQQGDLEDLLYRCRCKDFTKLVIRGTGRRRSRRVWHSSSFRGCDMLSSSTRTSRKHGHVTGS